MEKQSDGGGMQDLPPCILIDTRELGLNAGTSVTSTMLTNKKRLSLHLLNPLKGMANETYRKECDDYGQMRR